jgi:GNAT superfamily N-acetyltransferase
MSERDDVFWAEYFGISAADLRTPGLSIVRHAALAGYRGVWFFLHGSRLIASAPDAWLDRIRNVLARAPDPPELPAPAALVELFGASVERTIGPTFVGSLEVRHFRPVSSAHVRALTDADSDVVTDFRNACAADDWNDSAIEKAQSFRAAYFDDGRIVSVAGFRPWTAVAGDPCVVTLSDHRGRGCGKAVVSDVLAAAIARDHVLLYQTLDANVAAVRIALDLGYARYANRLAVRLI